MITVTHFYIVTTATQNQSQCLTGKYTFGLCSVNDQSDSTQLNAEL